MYTILRSEVKLHPFLRIIHSKWTYRSHGYHSSQQTEQAFNCTIYMPVGAKRTAASHLLLGILLLASSLESYILGKFCCATAKKQDILFMRATCMVAN